MGVLFIPDYLSDLNAMHEVEKVLDGRADYYEMLMWICDHDWQHSSAKHIRNPICATAAQRAEAFLRTIDKWQDEK